MRNGTQGEGIMNRVLWWAFNGMAAASAVFCAAISAMWLESYHTATPDVLELPWHGQRWSIESHAGWVRMNNDLEWEQKSAQKISAAWELQIRQSEAQYNGSLAASGQRFELAEQKDLDAQVQAAQAAFQAIVLPRRVQTLAHYAVLVALTFLLPIIFAVKVLTHGAAAQSRARRGRCPECGYDLRATPEKCPECGGGGARR
jgi:hypothetical protein